MVRLFIVLTVLFGIAPARAGEISSGKVTHIVVPVHARFVLFGLDGHVADKPLCNRSHQFAIHLDAPNGHQAWQALIMAKTERLEVEVEGLNTCSAQSSSEDVKLLRIR